MGLFEFLLEIIKNASSSFLYFVTAVVFTLIPLIIAISSIESLLETIRFRRAVQNNIVNNNVNETATQENLDTAVNIYSVLVKAYDKVRSEENGNSER